MIYHKLTGPDRHDINILRIGLGIAGARKRAKCCEEPEEEL
jgi:hypothetical protein